MSQAQLMFGDLGESFQITLFPNHPGFLLVVLPPGAFICLGLLIAGRNWLDERLSNRHNRKTATAPAVLDNETTA